MSDDVTQLDIDLREMIGRARDALEDMHHAEMATLRNLETTIRETVKARMDAGQKLLDAFGHLVPEDERGGQATASTLDRLANDISRSLRGG